MNVSAFALSLFKYPSTTAGDLTSSSPGWSYSVTSFPSGVTILHSMPGRMEPDEPNQISLGDEDVTTVHVSVSP